MELMTPDEYIDEMTERILLRARGVPPNNEIIIKVKGSSSPMFSIMAEDFVKILKRKREERL